MVEETFLILMIYRSLHAVVEPLATYEIGIGIASWAMLVVVFGYCLALVTAMAMAKVGLMVVSV